MTVVLNQQRILAVLGRALSDNVAAAGVSDVTFNRIATQGGRFAVRGSIGEGGGPVPSLAAVRAVLADVRGASPATPAIVAMLKSQSARLADQEAGFAAAMIAPMEAPTLAPITEEALTVHLRERLADPGVRAANLRRPGGGYSKETVLFDAVSGRGATPMALRRDKPNAVTGTSVRSEYPVVRALHGAGYRVPRPGWLAEDAPGIEGVFMTTYGVPGRVAGDHHGAWKDLRGDPVEVLASVLAGLHGVRVDGLDLPGFSDAPFDEPAYLATLAHWRAFYEGRGGEPDPIMEIALDWLAVNARHAVSDKVIVHGDFGFHNVMIDEDSGQTSLLDWELAHPGSAAEDLARAREGLSAPGAFDRFLKAYGAHGGAVPTAASMAFYGIYRLVRSAIIYRGAVCIFNDGSSNDLLQASICAELYPKNMMAVAELLSGGIGANGYGAKVVETV